MAYNVILTDGSGNIVIPIKQVSTNLASIPLVGREHSGYGQAVATAQIRMLENFAHTVAPSNPLIGQLWYDKGDKRLRVYDPTAVVDWKSIPNTLNELDDVDTNTPTDGQILKYNQSEGVWKAVAETSGVNTFAALLDTQGTTLTPNSFLRVNSLGSEIQYNSTISAGVISGTLSTGNIPDLDADKITSGAFDPGRIPPLSANKITSGEFDVARIPPLSANKITTDEFDPARIPNLPANKITGTFVLSQIPNLPAGRITSGAFDTDRIPPLDANKITSGEFDPDRIPDLDTSKITTGVITSARLPNSAKRSEINPDDLTNSTSGVQGFITGRRFVAALIDTLSNAAFGSIGTYVFGVTTSTPPAPGTGFSGGGLVEGDIIPGSYIHPSGGWNNNNPGNADDTNPTHGMLRGPSTSTLEGQWRVMGRVNRDPNQQTGRWRQTLFLRVS